MTAIGINIAGDLFLGRRVESLAKDNPSSLIDSKVLDLFTNADLNIVNLESTLSNAGNEHQIIKSGPNLKSSPETIKALSFFKINLVTLANNHIYDFGDKGLSDTLNLCEDYNISTVGAGLDVINASKIFYKKINGLTIAVLNISENEESNANDSHGGANPMNFISNMRSIREAKSLADIVILIIHGGNELYHYPSPRIVDQYRFYVEEGVSVIIGHHSHCISGFEIYQGVPIFYGLGNFLFDSITDFKGWYEGLLLNIQINQQKEISWKLHPYKQCKENLKIELLEGSDKLKIENAIKHINETIGDAKKLKEKYDDLIENQSGYILSMFSTSYILKYYYLRAAIRKIRLEHLFLRRDQLKAILNYTRCESLKDITFAVLTNYLKIK